MTDKKTIFEWRLDGVPEEAMRDWSEASNDANPIHIDPAAADALGFGPRCVNPGPTNLAYLMNMLAAAAPSAELTHIDARFVGNVLAGDNVVARGVFDDDTRNRCDASLAIAPDDKLVVTATMTFRERKS